MTMCLPPQYSLKQDGNRLFIMALHTGWESDRFELSDVMVEKSGMTQGMKLTFDLKVVVK